jgi:hypothetical protein
MNVEKSMLLSASLFPHRAQMLHADWHPGVHAWLRQNIGDGNFKYIKPKDAHKYLRYGFRTEEDALAFKLMFG